AADLRGQLLDGAAVDVGQHEPRAVAREPSRGGGADAAGRAGDEDDSLCHHTLIMGLAPTIVRAVSNWPTCIRPCARQICDTARHAGISPMPLIVTVLSQNAASAFENSSSVLA